VTECGGADEFSVSANAAAGQTANTRASKGNKTRNFIGQFSLGFGGFGQLGEQILDVAAEGWVVRESSSNGYVKRSDLRAF
jgi:hypothetical protein